MNSCSFTVTTATMGRPSLRRTIADVRTALQNFDYEHVLIWDDRRVDGGLGPQDVDAPGLIQHVIYHAVKTGTDKIGLGWASASKQFVVNLDDDCWLDDTRAFEKMAGELSSTGAGWGFWLRNLYAPDGTFIGVDRHESIGHLKPGPMGAASETFVDMNCMCVRRDYAMMAARYMCEFRDAAMDRAIYRGLVQMAGKPFVIEEPLVGYTMPERLLGMARHFCGRGE